MKVETYPFLHYMREKSVNKQTSETVLCGETQTHKVHRERVMPANEGNCAFKLKVLYDLCHSY